MQIEDGHWFVLHTRSRHEKALAEELKIKNVCHFLPLVRGIRRYGTRKAIIEEPLFPGYVFLHGRIEDAYVADQTKHVANIIRVADQTRIHWELTNLERALALNAGLSLYPHLKVGHRVEIRSGPFRGIQGLIEHRSKLDRVVLQIDMLGRATSLEVSGAEVDVID